MQTESQDGMRGLAWGVFMAGILVVLITVATAALTPQQLSGKWAIVCVLCTALALVPAILVLRRRSASVVDVKSDAHPIRVRSRLTIILDWIDGMPNDDDAARQQIDGIRDEYRELSRTLAEHRGLLGSAHVEIQMALGDAMVAAERVWTTLADHATDEANTAWADAKAHAARVRELLGPATSTTT